MKFTLFLILVGLALVHVQSEEPSDQGLDQQVKHEPDHTNTNTTTTGNTTDISPKTSKSDQGLDQQVKHDPDPTNTNTITTGTTTAIVPETKSGPDATPGKDASKTTAASSRVTNLNSLLIACSVSFFVIAIIPKL